MIDPAAKALRDRIVADADALLALVPQVADPPPVEPPVEPPPPPPPPVEPPAGTVPVFTDKPAALQPPLHDGLFFRPVVVENPDGSYTLAVNCKDKNPHTDKTPPSISLRYILDGVKSERVQLDPGQFTAHKAGKLYAPLVVARPADGVHGVTLRLIGAPSNARVEAGVFSVGKAPAVLPSYPIPVAGHSSASERFNCAVYDQVVWPGGNQRPSQTGKPRAVQTPLGVTEAGIDPDSMLPLSAYWLEPWTQFGVGLYHLEADYRRNADGWVICDGFTWQAGTHNATNATPSERRKPEYNGPRLCNQIDGYSTGRFGDRWLWNISLRGTLSRISLDTGEKQAIAGRVYRDETVALDHYDDSIKQAEIDAANWTFLGDAVDPDHLAWNAPHDAYPCPWAPDDECILLDSFNHRVFHVTAGGVVTLVLGNGQGREAGPIATAKIDRPYALIVRPDRSILLCCTPKAGDEQNSAVFEISSDWQTVREVAGPDKVWRPFWMCTTPDPDYVILWEHATGRFKRLNTVTGDIEKWGFEWKRRVKLVDGQPVLDQDGVFVQEDYLADFTYARPDGWGQVVSNVTGTLLHKGDWLFLTSQSAANTSIWRFDKDGVRRPGEYLKQSTGLAPQGLAHKCFEPTGHYVWWLDIHSKYAIGAVQGFGNTGPNFFRQALPTDPSLVYDHQVFGLGQAIYDNGTLPGFPCDLRPSGRGLRSAAGHATMGNVPGIQHLLANMNGLTFLDYWRNGAGGVHKRPEIRGYWADVFLYWAKWHSDDPDHPLTPPKKPNKPAPKVLTWGVAREGDTVTVSLTTDKPTWGVICDGQGVAETQAGDYATAHSFRLEDCGPTFVARLADQDGNIIQCGSVTV